jgi:hypothetical protein
MRGREGTESFKDLMVNSELGAGAEDGQELVELPRGVEFSGSKPPSEATKLIKMTCGVGECNIAS